MTAPSRLNSLGHAIAHGMLGMHEEPGRGTFQDGAMVGVRRPLTMRSSKTNPRGDGTLVATRHPSPDRRLGTTLWVRVAVVVGMAVATVVSVMSGISWAEGASRSEIYLPIAVFVAFGVLAVALTRFDIYLAGSVAARASLDVAKLTSDGGASGLDITGVFAIAFVGFGILWLIAQRPLKANWSPLVLPLVALILLAVLSIMFTPQVSRGLREVSRLGAILVLLLILQQFLTTRRHQKLILGAVFMSAVIPLAVAARQMFTQSGLFVAGGFERVTGTFTHPNPFATYLVMMIILAIAVLPAMNRWWRVALAVLILASGWALLLTYTRSAWIAVLAGLLVVGFLHRGVVFPILGVILVVGVLAIPTVADRFADLSDSTTASGQPVNSLEWRVQTWEQALSSVSNPVTGMGLRSSDQLTEANKLPHNDFVRMYVELGVVGLLVYLWLIASSWRLAAESLRVSSDKLGRGLAMGFAGVATAFLVLSLASNLMSQLVLLWYFAIVAALAWSVKVTAPESAEMVS